jgi:hypothetical protein
MVKWWLGGDGIGVESPFYEDAMRVVLLSISGSIVLPNQVIIGPELFPGLASL